MTNHDVQDSHNEWLEDIDYRREYGSESAKLDMATALAAARRRAGITQTDLAELAGVSQAYIAKLERGDANPSIGNIGRLFACMWFRPYIGVGDLRSADSFTLLFLGSENAMEPYGFPQPDAISIQSASYGGMVSWDCGPAIWSISEGPQADEKIAWMLNG